jgi:hypothetical protein
VETIGTHLSILRVMNGIVSRKYQITGNNVNHLDSLLPFDFREILSHSK